MPGRVSRSSLPNKPSGPPKAQHRGDKKHKQRSLNAFAIAQHQHPERNKIKQHRLGELEDDGPQNKRQRLDDNEGIEVENEEERRRLQKRRKAQSDELDIASGSDSEGHEWKMGEVGDDDDSDLDSDEAFGESDEERFEGFSLRGSSANQKGRDGREWVQQRSIKEFDLDEGAEEAEEDEDDLGEDAVDLATMLDDANESLDEQDDEGGSAEDSKPVKSTNSAPATAQSLDDNGETFGGFDGSASASEEEDDEGPSDYSDDDDGAFSISDAEDDNDPEKLKQLKEAVTLLSKNPSDLADADDQTSSNDAARMLSALKGMAGLDPSLSRSVKKLSRVTGPAKSEKQDDLVKVPLPKRQQDRIDRGVAYDKAKETLNRWIDTVKHNRRAEHLSFPLQDPHAQEAQGTTRLLPTASGKPQTELESTIQNILQASGLGGPGGKSEEDQIRGFEELETNKLSYEEVLARRAELRKARELLFREEVRSKRIKKIKSKAYRRVHRKEAQKEAQKQRDLLTAAGVEISEDEKEANDRRRAEERMGARHRESRWAKSVKQTGRGAWDADARDAVTEMARKNEDLRKRMEGKAVRRESDSELDDQDVSDDDEISEDEDGDGEGFRLRRQLDKVQAADEEEGNQSKLGQLKFMQRADAARKKQNDEDAIRLKRELDGEESPSEDQADTNIGRKLFGPTEKSAVAKAGMPVREEFEEAENSGSEDEDHALPVPDEETLAKAAQEPRSVSRKSVQKELPKPTKQAKPFTLKQSKVTKTSDTSEDDAVPHLGHKPNQQPKTSLNAGNIHGWTTVPDTTPQDQASDYPDTTSNDAAEDPLIPSNLDLVRAAFGGDDVEAIFATEKAEAAHSEDEKVTDNKLPGWGSWTGDGVSKREAKRAAARTKGRFLTKEEGIKPENRKDHKLKDVIVSERRNKKGAKYLAGSLPFPFETRQQYERSLRIPVGPEWTTKETFQGSTKPRVLHKAGRIINPMSEPML